MSETGDLQAKLTQPYAMNVESKGWHQQQGYGYKKYTILPVDEYFNHDLVPLQSTSLISYGVPDSLRG